MAQNAVAYVPTIAIYRLLASEPELFDIPLAVQDNAKAAAEAHPDAVRHAHAEGVLICHGTDFYSDMSLIPHAHDEFKALMDCGLSYEEAVDAGTKNALKVLGGQSKAV